MPFDSFMDKIKSRTKQGVDQLKLTGRIASLKVEKTTQRTERDRLLKDIGSKTYGIYLKKRRVDTEALCEEVQNELEHLERIDKRLSDIDGEMADLQSELLAAMGTAKDVVDAEVAEETDEDDEEDEEEEVKKKKERKKK